MRSVRRAICTSGEPVSPFLVAYSFTTCCLRSALSDIGKPFQLRGIECGNGRDVVQPGRGKLAAWPAGSRQMARLIHQFAGIARGEIRQRTQVVEGNQPRSEKLKPRTGCSSPLSMRPTAIRWPLQVA